MSSTLDIAGTRAAWALRLRRYVLGWPMGVFAAALLAPGLLRAIADGWLVPLETGAVLALQGWIIGRAFIAKLEDASLPPDAGLPPLLSAELVRALRGARTADAGSLLEAACKSPRGAALLRDMGIDAAALLARCKTQVAQEVDSAAFVQAAGNALSQVGESRVTSGVVLWLLLRDCPCCAALAREADLSPDDLQAILRWEQLRHSLERREHFWEAAWLARNGSVGRSWVMGYTDELDRLTREIQPFMGRTGESAVVIHQKEVDAVLQSLDREGHRNTLIVGGVGAGKRTMVRNAATALRQREQERHKDFARLLQLKTQDLLSDRGTPDAFLLHALNRAQSQGRFVLVIRELPLFLQAGNPALKGVLLKFLEAKNISVIGLLDVREYHDLVRSDSLLDSMFTTVEVPEATDEESMAVLMGRCIAIEHKRKVSVTYKALKSILELSKRYLAGKGALPGKAVEVLDDAVSRCLERGETSVRDEHVRDVISVRGKVDVRNVTREEKDRLLGLEDKLRARVIGQEPALKAVSSALKRARLDLGERKRPIGTFLFLGPTGVGKTQTAKALAEEYYGAADAIIRLDMNEYSHPDAVFGITGGGSQNADGFLARRVQDKPFSLVLLDEIEKAHPSVLNLFLQVLDEGFLQDHTGLRTDFRNAIIIATSNAGALYLRDLLAKRPDVTPEELRKLLLDFILGEKLFTPEFVNRFDAVVLFHPLTLETARTVAGLMLEDIVGDIRTRKGIDVRIDPEVVQGLAERGHSVEFGAREMRRTVTGMIEDYLAEYFLRHDVKRGDVISIKKEDIKW